MQRHSGRRLWPVFKGLCASWEIGDYRVAIIGQAFPMWPIAHPKPLLCRTGTFWRNATMSLQTLVDKAARHGKSRQRWCWHSHKRYGCRSSSRGRVNGIRCSFSAAHPRWQWGRAGRGCRMGAAQDAVSNDRRNGQVSPEWVDLDCRQGGGVKDIRYRRCRCFRRPGLKG